MISKTLQASEREAIVRALKTFNYNITWAAKGLDISRNGLQLKIKEHGIKIIRKVYIEEELEK